MNAPVSMLTFDILLQFVEMLSHDRRTVTSPSCRAVVGGKFLEYSRIQGVLVKLCNGFGRWLRGSQFGSNDSVSRRLLLADL